MALNLTTFVFVALSLYLLSICKNFPVFCFMGGSHDSDRGSSSGKSERNYCKGRDCKPRVRLSALDVHSFCEQCRGRVFTPSNTCQDCMF